MLEQASRIPARARNTMGAYLEGLYQLEEQGSSIATSTERAGCRLALRPGLHLRHLRPGPRGPQTVSRNRLRSRLLRRLCHQDEGVRAAKLQGLQQALPIKAGRHE